jgi:hypothetical protein
LSLFARLSRRKAWGDETGKQIFTGKTKKNMGFVKNRKKKVDVNGY